MERKPESGLPEHIAALLSRWDYERSPAEIVAVGTPALKIILDATDGKGIPRPPGADPRDFEDALQAALFAFGEQDLEGVLSELRRRRWKDRRIALSGLRQVADPRIAVLLLDLCASKDSLDRLRAIQALGRQKDPRATEALLRALSDRAESVRFAAIELLGERGEAGAIVALQALAKRSTRKLWIAKAARAAIAKIRRANRAR